MKRCVLSEHGIGEIIPNRNPSETAPSSIDGTSIRGIY